MNNKSQRNQRQVEKLEKMVEDTVLSSTAAEFSEIPDELHDISALFDEEERQKTESKKPTLEGLSSAVKSVDGKIVFIPEIDSRIAVEMNNVHVKSNSWLYTRVYIVKEINLENGNVRLWDEGRKQWASTNFITSFNSPNTVSIKIMPKNRTSIPEEGFPVRSSKTVKESIKPIVIGPKTPGKRGRPAGSKNRPKDVVKAERVEKIKTRAKKAEMKSKRRRGVK